MEKYIYISADVNDGDIVNKLSKISKENLQKILPLIKEIKENRSDFDMYNQDVTFDYYKSKRISEEILELFYNYCPRDPQDGGEINSIDNIEVYDVLTRKSYFYDN